MFGNFGSARPDSASERKGGPNQDQITEAADRLRGYAVSMAADVDAHQTRVQAVNNSLNDEESEVTPPKVSTAVHELIEANEEMQAQLQSAQTQIQNQAIQIETAERRAHTDALTRIPNRGALDKHLVKRHDLGSGKAGTLALLDVDHFKQFNDVYGHQAGDEVLRVVAQVLHAKLHKYGMVARFGGEEFAVVLDGCPIDKAKELVEIARIAIGDRDIQFEDKRLRVAACAGVAELVEGESIEKWLQRADSGLYRSKEVGRNCGHAMDGEYPVRIELTPADGESGADGAAGTGGEAALRPTTGALSRLPNRDALGESLNDMRSRSPSLTFMVMSVLPRSSDAASIRSLLQIVRATMRSIDRLGCEADGKLIVCMPSIDEVTAQQRAAQICRSAASIRLGGADSRGNAVAIGLASIAPADDFGTAVERAGDLAGQASEDGSDPIRVDHQAVAAS